MRRLVAIHIKGGIAVSLWAVGALCVAAEAHQPGFWYEQLKKRSGDRITTPARENRAARGPRVIGSSGHPSSAGTSGQAVPDQQQPWADSPEPAYQNNEVAAEQQAAEIPAPKTSQQPPSDEHTRRIVISIPDRRLALLEDDVVVKVYPVAVGASDTPSPDGEFTIVNHAVNPTYRHGDTEIAPGKGNPLGTRWMGLSLKGYGIHGTNAQRSVGKAVSHGCFRMKKKDVEELYRSVKVGDAVTIRAERDELTASLFPTPDGPATAAVASKGSEVASAPAPGVTVAGTQQ